MSVRTTVKSIQDIMRQDTGVDGDAQRISQLCWLFFLKIVDDQDQELELTKDGYRSPLPSQFQWRAWAADPEGITGEELLAFVNDELFPALKNLPVSTQTGDRRRVVRDVFEDAYNYMKSGQLMRQVVNRINGVDFNNLTERQHFGDIYEQILNDLQSAGNAGEYYTPRAVTAFMADRIDPRPGEILFDPACGTGGFLTCSLRHMRQHYIKRPGDEQKMQAALRAVEKKQLPHMLCVTNMLLHGIEDPSFVRHDNTLARPYVSYTQSDRVDIVLTNPPFGGREEDGIETNFPAHFRTRETADLFLALIVRLLKPGGRAAVVLPDGTLFGEGVKTRLKEHLLEECNLHTIVRLPNSVFRPYASIGTNLLFFEKGVPTKDIWFWEHRVPEGQKAYSMTKPIRVEHLQGCVDWWGGKKREGREETERIAAEKARLAEAGEIRRPRPTSLPTEAPFAVPTGWRWSQIAEIGFIGPRNEAPDTRDASFVPMPLISAEYGVGHACEIRPWGKIKKGYTHFSEGDVGLAKITPCFENGKSTVFRNLSSSIGAGTTELHVARPLLVNADYILIFLKTPHFIETGVPKMTGTAGQKRVPVEYFANSPFPLPPLAEQHRIVIKVDELMSLCDRLEAARAEREATRDRLTAASLARLNAPDPETFHDDARFALDALPALITRPDQIKQLRQTILNLAVRGKLVPQDAHDEPASVLLKQIALEMARLVREGIAKRPAWPAEADLGQAPFDLATGWTWGRFPELGVFGRGKSKHRPRNDPSLFDGGQHLMIQTGDVARSRGVIKTHTSKYNDYGLAQSQIWPKGTLCITIAANIADSGILDFDACFPDSVVGFVPVSMFEDARYFEYFMRTAKSNLLEFAPATAQKNINLEILNSVLIPVPPLAEQRRIVAKVDELMALCDGLEASLATGEDTRRRLLDALLAEALEPNRDDLERAA